MDKYDYLFKMIIIGDPSVGKTCIMNRFVHDKFINTLSTIGVSFLFKDTKYDGKKLRYQIWDTAGQERFNSTVSKYYRGACVVLIVYSVDDEKSFKNIIKWYNMVKKNNLPDYMLLVIVGNKIDTVKNQEKVLGKDDFKDEIKFDHWMYTSAKDNTNIKELFKFLGPELLERMKNMHKSSPSDHQKHTNIKNDEIISLNKKEPVSKNETKEGGCGC